MNATEILKQFRRMTFEEQCEVVQLIQVEFKKDLPPEVMAQLEARVERVRRHPELGVTWE